MLMKSQSALEEYFNRKLSEMLLAPKNLEFSFADSIETASTANDSRVSLPTCSQKTQSIENSAILENFNKTRNIKFTQDFGDENDVLQLIMQKKAEREKLYKKPVQAMKQVAKSSKKKEVFEEDDVLRKID